MQPKDSFPYKDNNSPADGTDYLEEAAKCPVCACSIFEGAEDDPVVWCKRCNTPHHADCWQYNGGCALYGCREQAPPDLVEIENWPAVLQDYHEWLAILDKKRKASVGFTIACLMAITFGVFGSSLTLGAIFPLIYLIPMYLTGKNFLELERASNELRHDMEPITGKEPFSALVTSRETTRWMAAAKTAVGNVQTGDMWSRLTIITVMLVLQFPLIAFLPLMKAIVLLCIDFAVLYSVKDAFVSMRKEQSILLQRFKLTFAPGPDEKSKAMLEEHDDKQ
jgi:hypothetical protein